MTTSIPMITADPEADALRRRGLRRMRAIAVSLLVLAAIVYVATLGRDGVLGFVNAGAEASMVGAIADWFAVTALFRYPLGLRIPHTNIIANRKDEIGVSLGEFVEENFLSDAVVRGKLESIGISQRVGAWLAVPENATRLTDEIAVAGRGLLDLLDDDDLKDLIESIAREHLVKPEWGPSIGRVGERLVASGQQHAVVNLLIERAEGWLLEHPEAFERAVSSRLPGWTPVFLEKMVDDKAYRETIGYLDAIRVQPEHPVRLAIDRYLADLARDLQFDRATIARAEDFKMEMLDSPRLREFASETWDSVKISLTEALGDPDSELRAGIRSTVADIGARLTRDPLLAAKINAWIADTVGYAVKNYRHEIAAVIAETVERWDATETADKIELQVGKDLQFIRINGTVVGALAGVVIFTVAQGLLAVFR